MFYIKYNESKQKQCLVEKTVIVEQVKIGGGKTRPKPTKLTNNSVKDCSFFVVAQA